MLTIAILPEGTNIYKPLVCFHAGHVSPRMTLKKSKNIEFVKDNSIIDSVEIISIYLQVVKELIKHNNAI